MAALRPTQASTLSANLPNPHVWPEQEFRVFIHTPPPASLTFIPWPGVSAEPSSPRWRRAPPRTASPSASQAWPTPPSPLSARPETAPERCRPWSRPQSVHVVAGGMTRVASPPSRHRPSSGKLRAAATPRLATRHLATHIRGRSSIKHRGWHEFLRPRAHDRATSCVGEEVEGGSSTNGGYTAGVRRVLRPKRRTIRDEKMAGRQRHRSSAQAPLLLARTSQKTTPGHWGIGTGACADSDRPSRTWAGGHT